MKTRLTKFLAAAVVALGAATGASAQDQKPQLKTLGVLDVSAAKSLKATADKTHQTDALNRLTESLNEQLLVAFHNTKKFEVVSRGPDMANLIKESNLPKGLILDDDGRGLGGKIKGLDNALSVVVTDFADQQEGVNIEGLGQRVGRRSVQATAIFKIYDATTGALVQAVRVPVIQDSKGVKRVVRNGDNNGAPDDAIVGAVAEELATRGATQVLTILYPVRVIDVDNDEVTLNRGEGTEVAQGQSWDVFAVGEWLVDPDTGAKLRRKEVRVGEIVVTAIQPTTSVAKIVGENRGIAAGAVARPKPAPLPRSGRGDPRDARDDRPDARRGDR